MLQLLKWYSEWHIIPCNAWRYHGDTGWLHLPPSGKRFQMCGAVHVHTSPHFRFFGTSLLLCNSSLPNPPSPILPSPASPPRLILSVHFSERGGSHSRLCVFVSLRSLRRRGVTGGKVSWQPIPGQRFETCSLIRNRLHTQCSASQNQGLRTHTCTHAIFIPPFIFSCFLHHLPKCQLTIRSSQLASLCSVLIARDRHTFSSNTWLLVPSHEAHKLVPHPASWSIWKQINFLGPRGCKI